jgi:hypothetical protein
MAVFHPRRRRRILFTSLQDKITLMHEHTRRLWSWSLLNPAPRTRISIRGPFLFLRLASCSCERLNERLNRRTTRPQHAQRAIRAKSINNRTLKADLARTAIKEKRQAARTAQIAQYMRGARRARLSRRVCAGRGER